jgi:hypothetical protein
MAYIGAPIARHAAYETISSNGKMDDKNFSKCEFTWERYPPEK